MLSDMSEPDPQYVKVHFHLEVEDDWPPANVESLWGIDRGAGMTELANTPFFVRGVAIGDVVETSADREGTRWAGKVVQPSQNCTIRLIVLRDGGSAAARQSVINAFHELGAGGEGIERFRMVSLDIPRKRTSSRSRDSSATELIRSGGTWKRAASRKLGEPPRLVSPTGRRATCVPERAGSHGEPGSSTGAELATKQDCEAAGQGPSRPTTLLRSHLNW